MTTAEKVIKNKMGLIKLAEQLGHGRLEVRTLTTSSQLNDFLDWPFL